MKSGSLWTEAVLHASHNFFIQAVFDIMTVDNGRTKLFTGEFGCGLAVVYALVAFYFWRRRGEIYGGKCKSKKFSIWRFKSFFDKINPVDSTATASTGFYIIPFYHEDFCF